MSKQDKFRQSETSFVAAGSGAPGPAENNSRSQAQNSSQDDCQREAIASSCGDGKGCVPEMARPLRLQCGDCEELVHQLSNLITPILMHAQMLEWRLPPYSHLKRPVRELERNARRAGELLESHDAPCRRRKSGHRRRDLRRGRKPHEPEGKRPASSQASVTGVLARFSQKGMMVGDGLYPYDTLEGESHDCSRNGSGQYANT
jgi:hypothetical protein